jgi:hypothetical protein
MYANLEINDTLYVFMHAEQVYHDMVPYDACSTISGTTIEDIFHHICSLSITSIVIDFNGIDRGLNGVLWMEKIIQHCNKSRINLTLCRITKCENDKVGLFEELKLGESLKKYYNTDFRERPNGNGTFNYICSDSPNYEISDEKIYDLYEEKLIERMEESKSNYIKNRDENEQFSHSSNVKLPKYINIKAFIEKKEISFLGLYLLYKKAKQIGLIEEKYKDENNKPLLFFSSMAGSYLASIFSKLAYFDMVFLNHLGPKNKLYRELHKEQILADRDYLIISDVVCLGAEIERAKTLIEYAGGKLKGIISVVLVDVVSSRPNKEKEIDKISLLNLTGENNKTIKYQIITDFPKI